MNSEGWQGLDVMTEPHIVHLWCSEVQVITGTLQKELVWDFQVILESKIGGWDKAWEFWSTYHVLGECQGVIQRKVLALTDIRETLYKPYTLRIMRINQHTCFWWDRGHWHDATEEIYECVHQQSLPCCLQEPQAMSAGRPLPMLPWCC